MAGLMGKIPAIPTLGAAGAPLRNKVYDLVMKRTSTYVGAIFICAMIAENTVDTVVDVAWRTNNKGKFFADIDFAAVAASKEGGDDY
jgi:hypothetical protein